MPRYIFKMQDLAPLQQLLGRPDTQRILQRAIPVKRFETAPKAVEAVTYPMPVKLRTRDNPNGLPLGDLNKLLVARVPGVRSVILRDNALVVSWDKPPTDALRAQLETTLTDRKTLQSMVDARSAPPTDEDALKQLQDESLPDAEWLKAFRRQQMLALKKGVASPVGIDEKLPMPTPKPTK